MTVATILRADARALPLADASVDLIVTSPPYFALRSYTDGGGHYAAQIGSEPTPQEYIAALIDCTREWMRVLKPGGSIWVNLGDSYYSGKGAPGRTTVDGKSEARTARRAGGNALDGPSFGVGRKSLVLLPERYRIACVDQLGLIARAVVIWSKPNGLPESVTDRVRRSHEDWVHLTKAPRYFSSIDEIREPFAEPNGRAGYGRKLRVASGGNRGRNAAKLAHAESRDMGQNPLGKLPGSVWNIASQPFKAPAELGVDHFAAFPMEWPRRLVLGWSPPGGVVLDPFGGTGTTAAVAKAHGRIGISVDMSADYCRLAAWRTTDAAQLARAGRPAVSRASVLDASKTDRYTEVMAADKEIMRQIEALRLDRPGRAHEAFWGDVSTPELLKTEHALTLALRELATTFREEAELWAKSGAKGWKGSEAEKYLVAQHIDDVAAQLDKAGGGAALSVSVPQTEPATTHERLDALVNAAAAEGRGMLRKTAHEWNKDPTVDPFVISWSDFGNSAHRLGMTFGKDDPITRADFERARDGGAVTVGHRVVERRPDSTPLADGCEVKVEIGPTATGETHDVTAYLSGAVDTLPGLAEALVPGSVSSAPEAADPFHLTPAEQLPPMPTTWESETLTADGHMKPGVAQTLAPTLGQPGDMGAGYSHDYVPPGGRRVTFAELLTPVPVASLPAHLSHSQGNTIGDCGVKYRLQRVEQLPQIPQWANIGGSAFHAAVEAFERTVAKLRASRDMTFKDYDCETVWKHHFEGQISAVQATTTVPISVWRAARKGAEGRAWWEVNGPLMLRRYLDARPAEPSITIDSGGTPAIEWEITADVPTPYGPLPYKSILDRVTAGPDGSVIIRDYKTSYERPTDTTQLGEYAHMLMLAGANLHGATRVLGTYFDARRGEWTEPVDLLAAHPFEAFQYRVTTAHAQKRALTIGPTPARPSSYCGGCSVRYACPIMASK